MDFEGLEDERRVKDKTGAINKNGSFIFVSLPIKPFSVLC